MNNAPTVPLGLSKKILLVVAAFFLAFAAVGHSGRGGVAAYPDSDKKEKVQGARS